MSSLLDAGPECQEELTGTGEILQDRTSRGRLRPWREKRLGTEQVAAAYSALGQESKAARCRFCGTVLVFAECPRGHEKRLQGANFCRERLCPMCAWRRSLRLAAEASLVLHRAAAEHPEWSYLLLTATQRNVPGVDLPVEVGRVLHGWNVLRQRQEFRAVAGWLRTLEVTVNSGTGEWHPHIHALLAVEPDYWHKRYVSQARWVAAWRNVLGLDYDPVVDVHRVRPRRNGDALEAAAREVGKYVVKDTDLLGDGDVTVRVAVLDAALRGRRLVGWGGALREVARRVQAEVPEGEEDLVRITGEDHGPTCPICGTEMREHLYRWVGALREYVG